MKNQSNKRGKEHKSYHAELGELGSLLGREGVLGRWQVLGELGLLGLCQFISKGNSIRDGECNRRRVGTEMDSRKSPHFFWL